VKRTETGVVIYALSVNYRGRGGAAVVKAAKSYYENLHEAAKIKEEVINSCAKLGD
jgi:hypothetical protein